ncbi:MAG: preprotein translocase subunit SecY [Tissierellia bacterium]|nr:preprotein translocase subunit SecY [Tissierellia bacterium]
MLDTLKKAWRIPELRKKIIYTFVMLIIFRVGSNLPIPGVDSIKLKSMVATDAGLLGFFNLMSGGSFKRFSVFALGISPYITSSIVMQLLQIAIPKLEELAKEGESGRKTIARYTRYLTVVLAVLQGFAFTNSIFSGVFIINNFLSKLVAVVAMAAGTAFLMFLGEKINENGIGNGISLFIFAGIISSLPTGIYNIFLRTKAGEVDILTLALFIIGALTLIVAVIYIQEGQRKIPVQYSKRVVGRKMYGGQSSHIPLKVNQTGVIPVIFSTSILAIPQTIAPFFPNSNFWNKALVIFDAKTVLYNVLNALLIIFFTYFYTSVTFDPNEIADNMKKNGGFIPGIRPGRPTANFISRSLNRLTIVGAVFLAIIASIPNVLLAYSSLGIRFGGTSLLIVVGVALETMKQIEAQLVMRHYKGFLR